MNGINPAPEYGIGVDTGGTYTDAVLIELGTRRILNTGKRPTTHHELRIGISRVLSDVTAGIETSAIRRIAFSTTLATNAIAEGRGAAVGLIVIGPVKHFDLPVVSVRFIEGGHDHSGMEIKPLDLEALVDAAQEWKGQMDAYAVASAMSFENPAHELVAEKAIQLLDPKPIFCSHRISDRSGIQERSATAVLHGRLMPVIERFIDGLKQLAANQRISADMVMIGGNARVLDLDEAVVRAANTVGSGPAATAWFGAVSTAARRAMVVDVGGTTTDIAMIENCKPLISADGSRIGRWRTHIDAVAVDTAGIGGDSLVRIDRSGNIRVGPKRVRPMAMTDPAPAPERWLGTENRCKCLMVAEGMPGSEDSGDDILGYLRAHGPASPSELTAALRISEATLERRTAELVFRKNVTEFGFTPTDALHVLDRVSIGEAARSAAGAKVLAAIRGQSAAEFCEDVLHETRATIKAAILGAAFRKQTGKDLSAFSRKDPADPLVKVSFALTIPLIGIGAAARELLPEVAESLGTQVIFPPSYDVGNAMGAILIASNKRG